MTAGLESDQDTGSNKVGQHPVPNRWRAGVIGCLREHKLRGLEAVRFGNGDRKPDHVQEEIQHDDKRGDSEDPLERLRAQVVRADPNKEEHFGQDPLDSSELDIRLIGGKRQPEDVDLGQQEVRGGLAVGCDERGPRGGAPPGNDESEESSIATSTGLGRPAVSVRAIAVFRRLTYK